LLNTTPTDIEHNSSHERRPPAKLASTMLLRHWRPMSLQTNHLYRGAESAFLARSCLSWYATGPYKQSTAYKNC